jgi:hypothetical protein
MAETSEELAMRCLIAWFEHVETGQATPEEERSHREFKEALQELKADG